MKTFQALIGEVDLAVTLVQARSRRNRMVLPPTLDSLDCEIERLTADLNADSWNFMLGGSGGGGTLCVEGIGKVTSPLGEVVNRLRQGVKQSYLNTYAKSAELLRENTDTASTKDSDELDALLDDWLAANPDRVAQMA